MKPSHKDCMFYHEGSLNPKVYYRPNVCSISQFSRGLSNQSCYMSEVFCTFRRCEEPIQIIDKILETQYINMGEKTETLLSHWKNVLIEMILKNSRKMREEVTWWK